MGWGSVGSRLARTRPVHGYGQGPWARGCGWGVQRDRARARQGTGPRKGHLPVARAMAKDRGCRPGTRAEPRPRTRARPRARPGPEPRPASWAMGQGRGVRGHWPGPEPGQAGARGSRGPGPGHRACRKALPLTLPQSPAINFCREFLFMCSIQIVFKLVAKLVAGLSGGICGEVSWQS